MLIAILAAVLLCASCADEKPVSTTGEPIQTIQVDGRSYRLAAAKANDSDLSIELSYVARGSRAYIEAVMIDGVEYRADCVVTEDTGTTSIPHYDDCADAPSHLIRDIDYTCAGFAEIPPHLRPPSPADVRLKVKGNESYLREQFENPYRLVVPPLGEAKLSRGVFNLANGEEFFVLSMTQEAFYIIQSEGEADTWGDLYKYDGDTIEAIAGTGQWADRGNFALQMVLEPGDYYLRVTPENSGDTGTYQIRVGTWSPEDFE